MIQPAGDAGKAAPASPGSAMLRDLAAIPPAMPAPPPLDRLLHTVARRYRLPGLSALAAAARTPAMEIALAIEQARVALARTDAGGVDALHAAKARFLDALAGLVRQALCDDAGDPVFRAMMLRHRNPRVREYASLSTHSEQDRRQLRTAVNAVAHPGRRQRTADDSLRTTLAQLHDAAAHGDWHAMEKTARRLLAGHDGYHAPGTAGPAAADRAAEPAAADRAAGPAASDGADGALDEAGTVGAVSAGGEGGEVGVVGVTGDGSIGPGLQKLLAHPALARLQRLDALTSDPSVKAYRALWSRHGPSAGSPMATSAGVASRERGAAAEAAAARALDAIARRLDAGMSYRVVTSMRVPATIPASHERAKSEWDVVLLRQRPRADAQDPPVWDICLLLEVKASVEAATSDFPRLLRGLRLLGHADATQTYAFHTHEGTVRLHGESLHALGDIERSHDPDLANTVLYCCDTQTELATRVLGAASRMQLLSAQASLDYAGAITDGKNPAVSMLEPVWEQLLTSPRWSAVLHQYPLLRQIRGLMVHTADLLAAAG